MTDAFVGNTLRSGPQLNRVLIIGSGGHGQVVADILTCSHAVGGADVPIGFLDDDRTRRYLELDGVPVLGGIDDLPRIAHDAVIIGIGDNLARSRVFETLRARGEHVITAVHPTAAIARTVQLGAGIVICAGAVVNGATRVGANAILNTSCSVDHHNVIGAHTHIAPGAHLGGTVRVEEGAFIGIGAAVIPQRTIGAWAVIGAGTVVTRDIPSRVTAVGVPARVLDRLPLGGKRTLAVFSEGCCELD